MNVFVGDGKKATEKFDKKRERRGLFLKTKKLMLDQADILYIESRAKKVEIHILGAVQSIEIYAAMDALGEQLGSDFYRCHRAYLVNMAHIAEYGNDSVTLVGGDKVPLAKKRRKAFVEAYQCHLRDGGVPGV